MKDVEWSALEVYIYHEPEVQSDDDIGGNGDKSEFKVT